MDLPDDQTRLRGGRTTAPRTLVETLSSAALARLLKLATAAYPVAILYTVVLIMVSHVYSVPLQAFETNDSG